MALNWFEAQNNEKKFWEKVYIEKEKDLYIPVRKDDAIGFVTEVLNRHRLKAVSLRSKIIMDLGCGPYGIIKGLDFLREKKKVSFKKLIGIDPLMNFYLKKIKILKNKKNIKLYNSKGEKIPLKDNSVDIVFSTNALDHCDDPSKVLSEIYRVLKPGGKLYCSLHLLYSVYTLFSPYIKYFDRNHPHHLTVTKFKNLIHKNSFDFKIVFKAKMFKDHPEFKKIKFDKNLFKNLKRFLSNYIIFTAYFNCIKK